MMLPRQLGQQNKRKTGSRGAQLIFLLFLLHLERTVSVERGGRKTGPRKREGKRERNQSIEMIGRPKWCDECLSSLSRQHQQLQPIISLTFDSTTTITTTITTTTGNRGIFSSSSSSLLESRHTVWLAGQHLCSAIISRRT